MGKRKSAGNNKTPPPSDLTSHAPEVELQPEQRDSHPAESNAKQSPSSLMDVMECSLKRPRGLQSALNQNHGSNRALLLRHSRPPFGRHYSRRSSYNNSDASPSNWTGVPVYDALSFKLASKDISDFPSRESGERNFDEPERIRSSSSVPSTSSTDTRRKKCSICQKRLRKNPFTIDDSVPSSGLSVVAVLVCGHAYHADCLEQKTSHEESQDPSCPLCVGQIPQSDA